MCCASNYANMYKTNMLAFKIIRILSYESNLIFGMESVSTPSSCVGTLFINHI